MWKERPGDVGYSSKQRKETKGKPREMEPCVGEAGNGSGGERKWKGWWVEWWQHRRQGWAWPASRQILSFRQTSQGQLGIVLVSV